MKKRIIATVVAVLLVMGMLPMSVAGASYSTVESVRISGLAEPEVGNFPSYTASVFSESYSIDSSITKYDTVNGPGYTIEEKYYIYNGIGWYDETDRRWMYTNDIFLDGHTYTAHVYIKAADSYIFSLSYLDSSINGNASDHTYDAQSPEKKLTLKCSFDCWETRVELVMLNNLDAPVAGETPLDYTFSIAYPEYYQLKEDYYVKGVRWSADGYTDVSESTTFEEGVEYKVQIALVPAKNRGMNVSYFSPELKAMVNGEEVVYEGGWNEVYVSDSYLAYVYYTLPAAVAAPEPETNTIDSVSISDINVPVPFEFADFSAQLPDDVNYSLYTDTNMFPGMVDGVHWMNNTDDGSVMRPGINMFQINHSYTVSFLLEAAEGYTFADDLEATVNASNAKVTFNNSNHRYVSISIDYETGDYCEDEVEFEVATPKAGESVQFYAANVGGAYYADVDEAEPYINGVNWYDLTDGYEGDLAVGDTFAAGHEYRLCIAVTPADGCSFAVDGEGYSTVKAYVNGEQASVAGSDSVNAESKIYIIFDFCVEGEADGKREQGDINGDGIVNAVDYNLIQRAVVGIYGLEEGSEAFTAADVNGDGMISAVDANLISRVIVGILKL